MDSVDHLLLKAFGIIGIRSGFRDEIRIGVRDGGFGFGFGYREWRNEVLEVQRFRSDGTTKIGATILILDSQGRRYR
jgi:hypothetical protein